MGKNFFALNGITVVEDGKETETHFIRAAEISNGDRILTIDFLKSKKAANWGEYLPAKVMDTEKNVLWNFKDEGFQGIAKIFRLERTKTESVDLIALLKGDEIHRIIILSDLGKVEFLEIGDEKVQLGGHDITEVARMKIQLGRQEGLKWLLTDKEKEISKTISEETDRVALVEKQKKEEARQARRQEIISRLNITVFNAEGKKLYGTPVQAGTDEWMALPDSSAAIECDWNAETQTASNPVCAFFVKKPASGKVKRVAEKTGLSFNDPTKKPSKNLQASGMRVFNIPGFDKPKPLVILDGETAKEVAKTVNSGTMVAIPISDEEFNIVALEKGSLKKICITKPIR